MENRLRAAYARGEASLDHHLTRQGALRYRGVADRGAEPEFLSSHVLAAPPVTSLRELEQVARKLTAKRIDDLDELRR